MELVFQKNTILWKNIPFSSLISDPFIGDMCKIQFIVRYFVKVRHLEWKKIEGKEILENSPFEKNWSIFGL